MPITSSLFTKPFVNIITVVKLLAYCQMANNP